MQRSSANASSPSLFLLEEKEWGFAPSFLPSEKALLASLSFLLLQRKQRQKSDLFLPLHMINNVTENHVLLNITNLLQSLPLVIFLQSFLLFLHLSFLFQSLFLLYFNFFGSTADDMISDIKAYHEQHRVTTCSHYHNTDTQ